MNALETTTSTLEVLVVDDSPVWRKIFEQILPRDLYSVSYATSAGEAAQIFKQKLPSIVITDWAMPDFSGLELCKRIREDKSASYTYIIVMTGKKEPDGVLQALEAGADNFLVKPFDSNEMLARVGVGRRIIELHRKLEGKSAELEEVASTDALTGDTVLRTFADTLRRPTRISDMCGRLGGDEFLIVISHVSAVNIEVAINRFRELFGSLSFPFAGQSVSISATFGVAGSDGNPGF
jgi:PleD family two-component response regulator